MYVSRSGGPENEATKYLHEGHTTPTSNKCEQYKLVSSVCLQLRREDSVPVQSTLLRSIGPVPRPKVARWTAIANI